MIPDFDRFRRDGHGASEALGFILLVGIVLLGATMTVVFGSSLVDDVKQENQQETARLVMQEVDARLTTLSEMGDVPRVRFDLGNTDASNVILNRSGHINITVNEGGASDCSVTVPLSSIRYQNDRGQSAAYEAGGVWNLDGDSSTMVTAPDLSVRNGSIDLIVVNMSGQIADTYNEAIVDVEESQAQSEQLNTELFQGDCVRPDNVTIKVQSDFYDGWGDYLETETGLEAKKYESNRTTEVYIPQDQLPRSTNDEENNVINLSTDSGNPAAAYMQDGTVDISGNEINVSKNASNTYTVTVSPLNERDIEIGWIERIENAQNISRAPLDVVFVLDESGSMDSGSPTKSVQAQNAARGFLTELNSSMDRAGVVSYDGSSEYKRTDITDQYLSYEYDDTQGVNSSIENIPDNPGGSTNIPSGLRKARKIHSLKSNQTRDQVVVLLTDGQNNPSSLDPVTVDEAKLAAKEDITIYSVGFGSSAGDFNETLLKAVANITGGQYNYSSNSDQLDAFFEDIAKRETSTSQIARAPLSTNLSGGGQSYAPFVPGDTDGLAVDTRSGSQFLNVNDPNAPSMFFHRFAVEGGEKVILNASEYKCADDGWRGAADFAKNGSGSFQVSRCVNMTTTSRNALNTSNVSIYEEGDDVSHLLNANYAWWAEENLSTVLQPYTNGTGHLNLSSNQVIAVFNFSLSQAGSTNPNSTSSQLALKYEIGRSEAEARADDVISVRVRNADLVEPN